MQERCIGYGHVAAVVHVCRGKLFYGQVVILRNIALYRGYIAYIDHSVKVNVSQQEFGVVGEVAAASEPVNRAVRAAGQGILIGLGVVVDVLIPRLCAVGHSVVEQESDLSGGKLLRRLDGNFLRINLFGSGPVKSIAVLNAAIVRPGKRDSRGA